MDIESAFNYALSAAHRGEKIDPLESLHAKVAKDLLYCGRKEVY